MLVTVPFSRPQNPSLTLFVPGFTLAEGGRLPTVQLNLILQAALIPPCRPSGPLAPRAGLDGFLVMMHIRLGDDAVGRKCLEGILQVSPFG